MKTGEMRKMKCFRGKYKRMKRLQHIVGGIRRKVTKAILLDLVRVKSLVE